MPDRSGLSYWLPQGQEKQLLYEAMRKAWRNRWNLSHTIRKKSENPYRWGDG